MKLAEEWKCKLLDSTAYEKDTKKHTQRIHALKACLLLCVQATKKRSCSFLNQNLLQVTWASLYTSLQEKANKEKEYDVDFQDADRKASVQLWDIELFFLASPHPPLQHHSIPHFLHVNSSKRNHVFLLTHAAVTDGPSLQHRQASSLWSVYPKFLVQRQPVSTITAGNDIHLDKESRDLNALLLSILLLTSLFLCFILPSLRKGNDKKSIILNILNNLS